MESESSAVENRMLTREELLDRLQAYAEQHRVVMALWLQNNDPAAYQGVLAHFGGIAAARRAAGMPRPSQREWSEARIINELRQLQRAGRVRITVPGLRAAGHQSLPSAIYQFLGSIRRARRLARIPEPGTKPPDCVECWDEDRVISEIRERHRNRKPLAPSKVPDKLKQAATFHCGSWQAAIEVAGLDYDQTRITRRPWTRQEVLARIKRAARERIRNPDGRTMIALVAPVRGPMQAFFGDLEGALRAADIDPTRVMRHLRRKHRSEDELLTELRAAVAQSSAITSHEFFSTRLGREAIVRFGSVQAAIDRMGPELWPARRSLPALSAEAVIHGLQARHREGGTMALDPTIREDGRLASAAVSRFGSWRRAMEAAGLGALVGRRPRWRADSPKPSRAAAAPPAVSAAAVAAADHARASSAGISVAG